MEGLDVEGEELLSLREEQRVKWQSGLVWRRCRAMVSFEGVYCVVLCCVALCCVVMCCVVLRCVVELYKRIPN
jgi:hypothetical protein